MTANDLQPRGADVERRTVIRFEMRDRRRERLWLLPDGEQSKVCVEPRGDTDDLVVTTSR